MTDVLVPLGVAQAKRGNEIQQLVLKKAQLEREAGTVFGLNGQPSPYLISRQRERREQVGVQEAAIAEISALSGGALRERYSPKPASATPQPHTYDGALDARLSSGFRPPAEHLGPSA
jgi:hypothetical protein